MGINKWLLPLVGKALVPVGETKPNSLLHPPGAHFLRGMVAKEEMRKLLAF